jgi:hypothetical protein
LKRKEGSKGVKLTLEAVLFPFYERRVESVFVPTLFIVTLYIRKLGSGKKTRGSGLIRDSKPIGFPFYYYPEWEDERMGGGEEI